MKRIALIMSVVASLGSSVESMHYLKEFTVTNGEKNCPYFVLTHNSLYQEVSVGGGTGGLPSLKIISRSSSFFEQGWDRLWEFGKRYFALNGSEIGVSRSNDEVEVYFKGDMTEEEIRLNISTIFDPKNYKVDLKKVLLTRPGFI